MGSTTPKPGKSLAEVNPTLTNEWHDEKNGCLKPEMVCYGSKKKVWWKCSACGHEWIAAVYSRNSGNGCPVCRYKKSSESYKRTILKNSNTLAEKRPAFLNEWDYSKNGDITPANVTPHSGQKVWWKCSKCGASWYATVNGRYSDNKGCPVCAGVKVEKGINDLATINPFLVEEWDYENNEGITPQTITANSNRKVNWVCSLCGNKWKALVSERNRGTGCPKCQKAYHTSFPEQAIFFYIAKSFPKAINSFRPEWLKKEGEIDIYIPEINLGIEYDGGRWHNNAERDRRKGKLIQEHGIKLLRINSIDIK